MEGLGLYTYYIRGKVPSPVPECSKPRPSSRVVVPDHRFHQFMVFHVCLTPVPSPDFVKSSPKQTKNNKTKQKSDPNKERKVKNFCLDFSRYPRRDPERRFFCRLVPPTPDPE